ncbi:MAG: polymerase III, alpha subunit protein [Parcubacteria group bacterium GW2011_GWC1_42_11]|uniref:DNA polymerase III subunit alpha n=1 Tax=Candidatus Nomurabacteria bacterium GW2011_GWC2_42_20 TaxID=1618756 RepID=A0A0G0ZEI6_9BACT|nr:MAG: polymerase III, alpha subunit protein [Parcubacteria group bacterium GW2011_GWC1_42_11]KKS47092.1 MAG: polymerase III, alpha subunit protein [Candidatus Nomurabacteria bacterium GW2011_GWC2_42_20]KKS58327.1 MAG: polymerase III, alpha subunit protein [Candidatus Nomurabacteria bacterium GW2011_GWA2_42_41]KKT08284.1 MAG: polymerase III, alpha subunit protein [Candidatus Nomurabacteria bacterium GW2011_GWB1_43_20]TAN37008.1 MAG: DNA polymerase III subunit alpha [Patescibacteria group bacte
MATENPQFIHLHTHSHYSLLDGLSKIDEMVALAKKRGMNAIGLTDHGNMYGAIEFYKKCKGAGIKPIIGVEAYVTPGSLHDKRPGIDTTRYHLTLLAKNAEGYKNLMRLVTISNLEGYYYKPRMDKDVLRQYSEGIICLSGCFGGELSRALRNRDIEEAEKVIREHQDIFGKENYFLEIMHHPGVENIEEVRGEIIALGKKLNIPLVATQDSHYLHVEDQDAHETLLAIQTNGDLNDENRFSMKSDLFNFIDIDTALKYFKDTPEAVWNTQKIADMCDIELDLGKWLFPDFKIPEGTTYDGEIHRLAYEGIPMRGLKENDPAVIERLEYELKVIRDKGYAPYFLVVADLLRFARENGILTNIRGSVAGSITTYLLNITNVNPLEYKLPFERFLNPERPSAPDIDMDYADNRREEVINYAREKYGADHVAQIGTFGTMMARGAVRDVARALGHPYAIGDRISRLIPEGSQGFPMTIDTALKMTPELADLYKNDADTKKIINLAKRLEGCVRHISVHAAGVVIAPRPLYEFTPTQFDPKGGKIITQYDMHAVEDAGLLKFDFLGIRNLSILGDAIRLVAERHGIKIDIDRIPLDDQKTFAILARGETMGLFQLNGSGMTRYLKELRPSTIHDINAMVALYRPGPMECIPDYIARKHKPSLVTYLDPRMKDILAMSFGVITYQDDVMMIAIKLAGYSWLDADKLRKAMGKKIPAEMQAQKEKLLKGFIAGGLTDKKAQELWGLIEPFAAYGFNKAHAASYGQLAYQTAYMKANYPIEYMTAILTAESGDTEKISEIITESKRMKLPILPPDINASFGDFTIVDVPTESGAQSEKQSEIRFGLYTIKNLGRDIADAIIEERERNGKYKSIADFLERIRHKNLNKKSFEALVKVGAMDELGERGQLIANTEEALEYNKAQKNEMLGQESLFGMMTDTSSIPSLRLKSAEKAPKSTCLAWERELLGLYVSGHPLDDHRDKLEKIGSTVEGIKKLKDGAMAVVGGIVEDIRPILTKKGDKMAFVKLTDMTGTLELVLFPEALFTHKEFFETPDKCIKVKGKISERNGEKTMIVERVKEL